MMLKPRRWRRCLSELQDGEKYKGVIMISLEPFLPLHTCNGLLLSLLHLFFNCMTGEASHMSMKLANA